MRVCVCATPRWRVCCRAECRVGSSRMRGSGAAYGEMTAVSACQAVGKSFVLRGKVTCGVKASSCLAHNEQIGDGLHSVRISLAPSSCIYYFPS